MPQPPRTSRLHDLALPIAVGLGLGVIDLGAIVAGFAAYSIARPAGQLAIQIPVAVMLTVGLFAVTCRALGPARWRPGPGGWSLVYLASMLSAPLVFVPLHYVTQGYWTSYGNLVGLGLFQLPTNALAVVIAAAVFGHGPLDPAPGRNAEQG